MPQRRSWTQYQRELEDQSELDARDHAADICGGGTSPNDDMTVELVNVLDAQAARIAELEAALCAFAPNNIKPGHWARPFVRGDEGYPRWRCNHCNARAREWQEIEHTSDCPIVLAVALLPKEATDE